MYSPSELNDIIQSLFIDFFGDTAPSVSPLPPSGSSRQYFRVKSENNNVIATFHPNIDENEACFHFTQQFLKCGLNVPEILIVHQNRKVYLQTDLGSLHLFDLVRQSVQNKEFNPQLIDYYKQVLTDLVRFQLEAHKHLDYNRAWPSQVFDKRAVIDDLLYFKYYFLKLHSLEYNEQELNIEFEKLADFLAESPKDFFMYRDFQSRNILIHNNKPFYIDFQGGKKGPLQYDLVSLLFQAKAQIPPEIRSKLKDHYLNQLSDFIDPEEIKFDKYYPAFIYLRLMQVLGAYGFRGLIQGKKHFVESIPYGLTEIENLQKDYPLHLNLPQLKSVLHQLVSLKELYKQTFTSGYQGLTVCVNSFSYLKGSVPYDQSGNGGGFVFDCRALPNPGRIDRYKMLTGQDPDVVEYLKHEPEADSFLEATSALICKSIDNYLARGFKNLMVSYGCTGGQHRSVYCAEQIAALLRAKYSGLLVKLSHLQLQNRE